MFLFLKPRLTADIVPFTLMQQEILRIFEDPPPPPPRTPPPNLAHIELSQSSLKVFLKSLISPAPGALWEVKYFFELVGLSRYFLPQQTHTV